MLNNIHFYKNGIRTRGRCVRSLLSRAKPKQRAPSADPRPVTSDKQNANTCTTGRIFFKFCQVIHFRANSTRTTWTPKTQLMKPFHPQSFFASSVLPKPQLDPDCVSERSAGLYFFIFFILHATLASNGDCIDVFLNNISIFETQPTCFEASPVISFTCAPLSC